VTVWDGSAAAVLEFLFWGGGLVVFPVVLIYTGAVFWIFRRKLGKVAQCDRLDGCIEKLPHPACGLGPPLAHAGEGAKLPGSRSG
jgi:hypothetical protein